MGMQVAPLQPLLQLLEELLLLLQLLVSIVLHHHSAAQDRAQAYAWSIAVPVSPLCSQQSSVFACC